MRSSQDANREPTEVRKIYTAESVVEVAHLRNLLESAGIECLVRNDRLGGAVGEIPFVECWPELWVRKPGDALRARGMIDQFLRSALEGEPWTCPGCGERIESQFSQCWRCATHAPPPEPLR